MYTRLSMTVAAAMDVAGSVSAAEMARGAIAAEPSMHRAPAGFLRPAIASLRGISNGLADLPGA